MKLVIDRPHFAVLDDVLSEADLEELRDFTDGLDFRSVHEGSTNKAWRIHDGAPLTSVRHATYRAPDEVMSDPAYLPLSRRILDALVRCPSVVLEGWRAMSCAAWIYPCGSAISLHLDGREFYAGAYVFYLHPSWHHNWGGQLLMFDPEHTRPTHTRQWLRTEPENSEVMAQGHCDCVLPKPNRLVLVSPMAHHMVTRVDPSAGHHSRVSIAGFFSWKEPEDAE